MDQQKAGGVQDKAKEKITAPLPDMAFDPIEAALRQLHEHMLSEQIPEDFLRLLDKLDGDETGGKVG